MSTAPVELLLVEDSDEDAELVLRALSTQKLDRGLYRVVDGAEALAFLFGTGAYEHRLAERPPRVVLLDLNLPRLPGLDVLREVRGNDRTRALPVVVLSASAAEADLASAYALGANSYIVKPLKFDDFVVAVGQLGKYWGSLNVPPFAAF